MDTFLSSRGSRSFMSSPEADVVVSIDFGTTFSGCAYATRSNPSKVYSPYLWPDTDGQYPKTKTELYYSRDDKGELVFQSWGATALVDFTQAASEASGVLIREFKLHLAPSSQYGDAPVPLPANLTVDIVITDYLREISKFYVEQLRETFGGQFSMKDVQWCLTVPAIWDDRAKQLMKTYAEAAGLTQRRNPDGSSNEGSPYPLVIILEPEAAAVCSLTHFKQLRFDKGDKFMTADLGGGTVDIVIHEKVWQSTNDETNLEMKEVAKSSGGLCGATFVDKQFLRHLETRIPCFRSFSEEHPKELIHIMKWWDSIKIHFNGTLSQWWSTPLTLAEAWRLHDERTGRPPPSRGYGHLEFTKEDLINIFAPVVKNVILIIEDALHPFAAGEVNTIMAVGGFSGNPYLKKRLRETFIPRYVKELVVPPNPGAAIFEGAVMLGIAHKDLITSRVSRRTYGQAISRKWKRDDPEELQFIDDDGVLKCNNVFQTFVRNGEEVPSGDSVSKELSPLYHNATTMAISIYSSEETAKPKYITDAGVVLESEFEMDISAGLHLDKKRVIAITMYFGRSSIQVTAKGVNFEASGGSDKAIPVSFKGAGSSINSSNAGPSSMADDLDKTLSRMRAMSFPFSYRIKEAL